MKLKITLTKSLIACRFNQIKTAHCLGLKKINNQVIKDDTPAIHGMIKTISHLVVVEKVSDTKEQK
ncbi:MAG: 50S ribosomal protein L30 [Candidatus Phytoplasma asteris]|uniref:50S ribosomal protein L30 n=1 Tax='Chrysanthemum coronarium' phytoplasma TaxID=1520703 RepID=A0ABQ0J2S8_9MOLU|nr:50S ribosomal protein L30 ['Chrysanthemum coronarium' phytoplasma]TKA87573.1 MAG: 50S ribosomal protein L30 [Periwinkle leaf yellowing phytoplasma]WEX19932.1 MAG: 50S ribosomal protein L30 [Candidatus Phytoplasma asteris]GAK73910.1 ribosomal protein L30/L7E ['Chrysanthemum coronarium' phytoplasma]